MTTFPRVAYTPEDWYWFIGADTTNVWSSKRCMMVVASTDQEYIDWSAVRGAPTLGTMAELEEMMTTQFPPGTLKSYNPYARYNKASGGVVVTSISAAAFMSDPVSRNTLANADAFAKANPGHMTDWKLADGTFVTLSEAQLATALNDMAIFVQSCFTCESANLTDINGGTITTIAQIDAAYAAISNVFP